MSAPDRGLRAPALVVMTEAHGAVPLSKRPLRVLVADANESLRHTFAEVINAEPGMEVVAEAADGEQAVWLAKHLWPTRLDLVLMDLDMPRLDGITATARINTDLPGLPVVMLAVAGVDRSLFAAIKAGAVGYLIKDLSPAALVRTLRDFDREDALPMSRVLAGRALAYFQRQSSARRARSASSERSGLSPREREVLELIARGEHDREIGLHLTIAERTVKKHVENILRKLSARNRAEAAARFGESR